MALLIKTIFFIGFFGGYYGRHEAGLNICINMRCCCLDLGAEEVNKS